MDEWTSLGKINITYEELINYLGEDVFNTLTEWDNYETLNANKEFLTKLFHLRYDCKMLGYATTRAFLARLELRFEEVAPRYNLAMEKYLSDADNIRKAGVVVQRDYSESIESSLGTNSKSTNDNTNNFYDTPKTNVLNELSKPSNASVNSSTGATERTDNGTVTTERNETETDSQNTYLLELNKIIDSYRGLNTDFINEFEDLFLNIKIFS